MTKTGIGEKVNLINICLSRDLNPGLPGERPEQWPLYYWGSDTRRGIFYIDGYKKCRLCNTVQHFPKFCTFFSYFQNNFQLHANQRTIFSYRIEGALAYLFLKFLKVEIVQISFSYILEKTNENYDKWYFVIKIVLIYCEKKLF